jgi:putative hydrolase of the HAD superfamily
LARFAGRVPLGIISDGPQQMQANKVEALGLIGRVDEIILTDAWGRQYWKPHVRAFEEMASRLRVSPQECLYVADNPSKDFIAPNALSWRTVQVRRAGGVYADRIPPGDGRPGAIIESLDALAAG